MQDLVPFLLGIGGGLNPYHLHADDQRRLRTLKRRGLVEPSRFAVTRSHFRPAIIAYRLTDAGRAVLAGSLPEPR